MDERPNKESGKLRSNFACGYDRAEAPPKVCWDKYSISESETQRWNIVKKKVKMCASMFQAKEEKD